MDKSKNDQYQNTGAMAFQIRESYKTARTNIAYSIIKKGCKKILFTSASKGEGKTITAVNTATALAQQVGVKVLIIDCDLRRPQLHSTFKISSKPGLTNYLNEECSMEAIIQHTKIEDLDAVCYGIVPPNPSELLSSEAMENFIADAEKLYDYIILDTPPISVVVDAIPLVKLSDGVVVVVRDNATTYPELQRTLDIISRSGGKTLGVIVNRVKTLESKKYKKRYGGLYSYYG